MTLRDRACGCLLGLVAGDAVGTTVEFKPRGGFQPLTDMVRGGPFGLKAGQWSDDTSTALCLGYSLDECSGFDAHDQMERSLHTTHGAPECLDASRLFARILVRALRGDAKADELYAIAERSVSIKKSLNFQSI